jgi:hypothetical protein
MIKFFRKNRKNLLMENPTYTKASTGSKTGKYLKYAIGEIILVVIGILIALQINNWNEQRKKVQVEIHTLVDIKSDIEENIQNLENGIIMLKESNINTLKAIDYYQNKTPYSDSVQSVFNDFFGFWDPDFTYAAFENLKNQGVNLISSESLRKTLIRLHEVEMNILDVSEVNRQSMIYENIILPIQKKYFFRSESTNSEIWPLVPSNYQNMINDREFYAVCTEVAFRQTRSINRFRVFNIKAKEAIEQIDKELEQLK